MKRFLKYYREKRGISLVWITLFLFVLLVFAATAIDISYMYHAKTQLQLAADASALAAVGDITNVIDDALDGIDFEQEDARRKAWKFACLNKAAGEGEGRKSDPVYLVTSHDDCEDEESLTAAQLNGGTNDIDGDIVVGNWNPARTEVCPSTGIVEPFCPANGSTMLTINAVKTVARRTFDAPVANVSIGDNPVRLFLGQVFRYLNKGGSGKDTWKFMNANAEAIASYNFEGNAAITICFQSCTLPIDPEDPLVLYLAPYPAEMDPGHGIAWTVFDDESPSIPTGDVIEFFCEDTPDACYKTVYSDNGSVNAIQRAFRCAFYNPLYDSERKTCADGACDDLSDTVTEWRIIVPVFSDVPGETTPCPPGAQPEAKTIEEYAEITVIEVYAGGGAATNCACEAYDADPEPPGSPNAIVVTAINCVSCDDLGSLGFLSKLVK